MRRWRYFALIVAGLMGVTLAYADRDDDRDNRWKHQDRDRDRDDGYYANRGYGYGNQGASNRAYQDGFARGQDDRARNRNYNPNRGAGRDHAYRDAYRSGYDQGYNQGYANRGYRDRNYPYPDSNSYPYGYPSGNNYPYGGNYSNQAYSVGVQDGRYDGQRDRQTGHSFRPTEGDRYKHADRGYSSSFGNKDAYKQEYRQGYLSGYQQGYGR